MTEPPRSPCSYFLNFTFGLFTAKVYNYNFFFILYVQFIFFGELILYFVILLSSFISFRFCFYFYF